MTRKSSSTVKKRSSLNGISSVIRRSENGFFPRFQGFGISRERLNCDGERLESVLAREHEQIQRLKERGLTDEEIDALGEEKSNDQLKFYTEDENENKNS